MTPIASSIRVQDLDHCGIVAGIIDQMGLVEQINQELGTHPQEILSAGVGVKAMIINGLGLVSAPLYLFERFFVGKATEHLLGEGIKPKHLNDDRLGRVLDQLFEAGLTQLFVKVALAAASKFGVNFDSLHLDSSSFHVHGSYLSQESLPSEEPTALKITHGYSRDHRPDLKQFMVDLICSGDGDVPLYLRVADGNESDQAVFAQLMKEFRQQWDGNALFVADAALYNQENLQSLTNLRWLSRVPGTIKGAQQLMEQLPEEAFHPSQLSQYRWSCVCSTYAGIKQQWLIVESQARKEADLKHLEQKIQQHQELAKKQLKQLGQQDFACAADALAAGQKLNQQLRYHRLCQLEVVPHPYYRKAGRPRTGQAPDGYHYRLQGTLTVKEEVVALARTRAGRFVLATNVLESKQLSPDQLLCQYKGQQSTERGFRFLKDPMFFTDSVFLKTPERVAALAMVMGLCLLVYTLAQRALRQALTSTKQKIQNQLGKPTATPTMRWVFQCFQSIHLVILNGVQQIVNLTPEHQRILQFLGAPCQKYYLLV
ncbi:MAG: IS1634 family transposase [Moorea sp. SIO3I7]|uniref:IS1634 family transposase n=1 Tax=Moorena sp. SIO3I8 TaxID=2607833 RepID=UPI0013BF4335|nr:IS1634 family transposase [Moorena sp. SIO3I8]NEN94577.1 IS1634 family transposase [Moorena sp. SIO3I7]NEO07828.1 IS1634 family transposase [Moorena sp. SIO3I8]NEO63560.1 IS1634 family transposase [Moorena sp. SIO4G2]